METKVNDGLVTQTTVIKNVAKELGFSEKQVKSVYYGLAKYLKHLVHFSPATSISVPHLGKLHARMHPIKTLLKYLRGKPERKRTKERIKMLEEKERLISEHYTDRINGGADILKSKHYRKKKMSLYYYTQGISRKEIARIQNEEKK